MIDVDPFERKRMIHFYDLEKSGAGQRVYTIVKELNDLAVTRLLVNLGGIEESVAERMIEEGTWVREGRWRSADERYEIELRDENEKE